MSDQIKKVFSILLVVAGAFLLLYTVITLLALNANLQSIEYKAQMDGDSSLLAQASNIRGALIFAIALDFGFCVFCFASASAVMKAGNPAASVPAHVPVPAGPRYCPSCGTEVPPTSSFCGKCGAKA